MYSRPRLSTRSVCLICTMVLLPLAPLTAQEAEVPQTPLIVPQQTQEGPGPVDAAPEADPAAEAAEAAAEAEAARLEAEEEAARIAAEEEAARIAAEEADRLAAEEEAARIAAEEEAARIAAEEAARLAAEEEAARIAAEQEAARIAAEEEAARIAAEQEAARIAAEEEAARLAAEEEARRLAEEEAAARQAAIDAAVATCMETAGPPSAEVPISEDAQRAVFARLREALPACREAMDLAPDAGGPLFHMATVAQARGQHREAIDLYERAAAAGIGAAHTRLGDYYNFGIGPIRADTDRAIDAYRAAVDLDDPAGTATLAFMYRLGRGVSRDPERMIDLFRQAADQGYHFAQVNLAQTYLTGEGVPGGADDSLGIPDPAAAVPLLSSAARAGNLDAALALAQIFADGAEGVPPNAPSRFRWTNRAASAGSPAAIAARAFLLERGIGTSPDPDRAAQDYVRALETGEVRADDLRAAGGPRPPAWDRDTAMAFQVILQDRGLYDGPIDGIVGGGTMAGARALDD